MPTNKHPSIDRLPDETAVAYEAFLAYIELGADRSLEKARLKLGKAKGYKRLLDTWSSTHRWQDRLREYQKELKAEVDLRQEEILLAERSRYLNSFSRLNGLLEDMLQEAQTMRTSKRAYVDDPRDAGKPAEQRRRMEVVTLKLNTRDMTALVQSVGTLHRDMRVVLGLPQQVDVTSAGKAISWPAFVEVADAPQLPEPAEDSDDEPEPITLHTNGHSKPVE